MQCIILTEKSGISFQFDDLIKTGEIRLNYELTGQKISYFISNTNYFRLSATLFSGKGAVTISVLNAGKQIKKKKIIYYTF